MVLSHQGKELLIVDFLLSADLKLLMVLFNIKAIPGRSWKGAEGGANGASGQQGRHGAPQTSQLRRRYYHSH